MQMQSLEHDYKVLHTTNKTFIFLGLIVKYLLYVERSIMKTLASTLVLKTVSAWTREREHNE